MASHFRTSFIIMSLIVGAIALTTVVALASPTPESPAAQSAPPVGGKASELYKEGMKAVEVGDFTKALRVFERANTTQPDDPDILNMLAFSLRKNDKLDDSLVTYQKALKLRPRFPQAREYLGECYLQLAMREAKTLSGYGKDAHEELGDLVRSFKDAAAKVQADHPDAGNDSTHRRSSY